MGASAVDVEALERGIAALDRTITEEADHLVDELEAGTTSALLLDDLVALAGTVAELERRWHRLPPRSPLRDTLGRTERKLERVVSGAEMRGTGAVIPAFLYAKWADIALVSARWIVGQAIRSGRVRRGFSGRRLSQLVGVSNGYLSELEIGKAGALPSQPLCERLDAELGMAVTSLVGDQRRRVDRIFAGSRAAAMRPPTAGSPFQTDPDVRVELVTRALRADASLLELVEGIARLSAPVRGAVASLVIGLGTASEP
jgi:transcriptional regulator with XRE-family HTH domain